jgi:hypothetical protein
MQGMQGMQGMHGLGMHLELQGSDKQCQWQRHWRSVMCACQGAADVLVAVIARPMILQLFILHPFGK